MSAKSKLAVSVTGLLAVAGVLTGCAGLNEANHYNAPPVHNTFYPDWLRIGTPSTYPTLMFGCHGTDGIYVANDSYTSAFVVKDDPSCLILQR